MRRIALFLTVTVAMVVLLFSYRTSRGAGTVAAPGVAQPARAGIVAPSPRPGTTAVPAAPGAPVTVNGPVAQTMWGPVQVQVIVESGRITDVTAIEYPNGNRRDEAINAYALPLLHDQVLAAQSAAIDGVSGATVTSEGYVQSLQAALDLAHVQ